MNVKSYLITSIVAIVFIALSYLIPESHERLMGAGFGIFSTLAILHLSGNSIHNNILITRMKLIKAFTKWHKAHEDSPNPSENLNAEESADYLIELLK